MMWDILCIKYIANVGNIFLSANLLLLNVENPNPSHFPPFFEKRCLLFDSSLVSRVKYQDEPASLPALWFIDTSQKKNGCSYSETRKIFQKNGRIIIKSWVEQYKDKQLFHLKCSKQGVCIKIG